MLAVALVADLVLVEREPHRPARGLAVERLADHACGGGGVLGPARSAALGGSPATSPRSCRSSGCAPWGAATTSTPSARWARTWARRARQHDRGEGRPRRSSAPACCSGTPAIATPATSRSSPAHPAAKPAAQLVLDRKPSTPPADRSLSVGSHASGGPTGAQLWQKAGAQVLGSKKKAPIYGAQLTEPMQGATFTYCLERHQYRVEEQSKE
jgi:hypothetical protein